MASLFSEFIHHLSHPFLRTTACEQCILCPDTYMACLLSQSSLLGIRGREKERREREGGYNHSKTAVFKMQKNV
jgi:hypothetical protein